MELGPGGNNLKAILAHVETVTGTGRESTGAARDEGGKRRLQVDCLVLSGARFRVGATALGGSVPVRLPDLTLEGLGTDTEGITEAELAQKILGALVAGTADAAQQALGSLGQDAAKAAEQIGRDAAEAASKIGRGLGDWLKKKD